MIGDYSSAVTFGQSRALVVWERIIFPSGKSLSLQNFPGVDLSGFAGFKDKVNNHTLRIISSVVLGSLVAAGTEAANGGDDELQVFVEGLADGTNRAVDRIVQRNLSIQPILEIRPGYRFNVFVHSDIVLPAYDAS